MLRVNNTLLPQWFVAFTTGCYGIVTVRSVQYFTAQDDTVRNHTVVVSLAVPDRSKGHTAVLRVTPLHGFTQEAVCCTVTVTIRSYITTETSVELSAESPVLVTQACVHTSQEVRVDVTHFFYNTWTFVVNSVHVVVVIVSCWQYRQTRSLVNLRSRVRHQQTVSTTYLGYRTDTVVTVCRVTCQTDVVSHVFVQFHNLGIVLRECEVQVPSPVLSFNRSSVQRDFETWVLDVTCIDELVLDTWLIRNGDVHQLVLGIFLIVCDVHTDAVFQESPVQTNFPRVLAFRLQVGVINCCRNIQSINITVCTLTRNDRVCRVDDVRACIVTYLCPRTTNLHEWNPFREWITECLVEQPRTRNWRIEERVVTCTVCINHGRRPVVTACYVQEDLILPACTGLECYREDSLFTLNLTRVTRSVLWVTDEELTRNDQTTVGVQRHSLFHVVVVFTAEETVHCPVTPCLVEGEVGVQVGLFLGVLTHSVVTTVVGITITQFLGFVTLVVVVVVTFYWELQPVENIDVQLQARTYGSFLLTVFIFIHTPPDTFTRSVTVFVTVCSVCQTTVSTFVTASPVAGIVHTSESTVCKVLTQVGFTTLRVRVCEADTCFHFYLFVQLVSCLSQERNTREAVVRSSTVGILVRQWCIEVGLFITALYRNVGVGVEAHIVCISEVVFDWRIRNHGIVESFDRLAIESRTEVTGVNTDQSTVALWVQFELLSIPLVTFFIEHVTGVLTLTILVLEVRTCIYVVETESLRETDTETLGTFSRLGSNNDSTVQTARTVKSCCSSTLQYRYGFEVVRVQVLQFVTPVLIGSTPVGITVLHAVVKDYTVHNVDRLVVGTQSRSTTDQDLGRTEQTTVTCCDVHTGNLTLQCRNRVHHVGVQVFTLHFCHGVTQSLGRTLHTESGYHHFFQSLSVIVQSNVERSTVPGNFLSLITYERNLDDVTLLHVRQRESTVEVGNSTVGCTLHDDRSTDHGFTQCVLYHTGSCFALLCDLHIVSSSCGVGESCSCSSSHQEQHHTDCFKSF